MTPDECRDRIAAWSSVVDGLRIELAAERARVERVRAEVADMQRRGPVAVYYALRIQAALDGTEQQGADQ